MAQVVSGAAPAVAQAASARSMRAPAAVGAAAVGALALLVVVDPGEPGHYPLCPFHALTGLDCPGCGTLRALHDLGSGDLRGALDHNLLAVLALPVLLWVWVRWAQRSWQGRPGREPYPRWLSWGLLAVLLGWWVVRNLPWFGYLGSG